VCGKKKLSVNANTGKYQCWKGCMGGHVDHLLGDTRIARIESAPRQVPVAANVELPGELVPLTMLDPDHHAVMYLKRRKCDIKQLNDYYGIRYCTIGRRYAGGLFQTTNTLVIPVYMSGRLVGWQARLLYDPDKIPECDYEAMGFRQDSDGDYMKPPKYFTMPGMDKGQILWNYDWARQSRVVVICEGVFDAISVGRCAVATFGKGVSDTQRGLVGMNWDLAIALLDPDAERDNIELAQQLSTMIPTVAVTLQGYKDAGEAPQAAIWQQIDQAVTKAGLSLNNHQFIV
jgi:hypothetical protein